MEYKDPNKQYKLGHSYVVKNGCPKCGSDLEVTYGVAEMCINWQHPHCKEMYNMGGLRNCDYVLLGG